MGQGSKKIEKVFAVVVTYNALKWVEACIGSLSKSNFPLTTIIVDNNSSDGTVAWIKENCANVALVSNAENLGFGKANNLGISMAIREGAEYVLLLNQDAWIEEDTIESLIMAFRGAANYGIISPLHLNGSGTSLDAGFANCIRRRFRSKVSHEATSDLSVKPVDFINAAAWMINRNCLKQVGGFHPHFHHYGEDREYANRLAYHKIQIGFVTNCRIFHDRESRNLQLFFSTLERISWYYRIGLEIRLMDARRSFFQNALLGFAWSAKDFLFHFFKGRWFALRAAFDCWSRIFAELYKLMEGRKLIKSNRPFLFLDDH
jgi:N-acetylglucosaminyl-diphospho-decaprenol L-rhamnosyltransferase